MGNRGRVRDVIVHETRRIKEGASRVCDGLCTSIPLIPRVLQIPHSGRLPAANKLQLQKRARSPQKDSRQPPNCVQRLHVRRNGPSPPIESRKGGTAERGTGGCGAPLRAFGREGRPELIECTSLHLDVLCDLSKAYSLALCSVAYPVLEAAGEMAAADTAESDPITLAVPPLDPPPMPSTGRNFPLPTGIRS